MGECLITRRSGIASKLTVLDDAYPADTSVTYKYGNSTSATFQVVIAEHGVPANYSYQWYFDGYPISDAIYPTFTKTGLNADGTHRIYCEVTNSAGTVTTREATLTVSLRTTYLYNKGDSCTSVTGGWAVTDRYYQSKRRKPTLTLGSSTMTVDNSVSAVNKNFENGCVETNNAIDLTDYSTLTFVISSAAFSPDYYGAYAEARLGVAQDGSGSFSFSAHKTTSTSGTFTVDVSSLSGSYVVVINIRQQCGGKSKLYAKAEFSQIYLT